MPKGTGARVQSFSQEKMPENGEKSSKIRQSARMSRVFLHQKGGGRENSSKGIVYI